MAFPFFGFGSGKGLSDIFAVVVDVVAVVVVVDFVAVIGFLRFLKSSQFSTKNFPCTYCEVIL